LTTHPRRSDDRLRRPDTLRADLGFQSSRKTSDRSFGSPETAHAKRVFRSADLATITSNRRATTDRTVPQPWFEPGARAAFNESEKRRSMLLAWNRRSEVARGQLWGTKRSKIRRLV